MKIAFFVNTFPALSQTFILSQIVSLTADDHEVDIFARKRGDNRIINSHIDKLNLKNMTVYYGWRYGPRDKSILKYLELLTNFIRAGIASPGMLSRFLSATRCGRRMGSLSRLNDIFKLLQMKPLRYDIIHCHFGPNGNTAAILKKIGFLEGKIITTFHGYDMSRYISVRGEKAYETLFDVGDLFLPVSEKWKSGLISLGCSENKIRVHRMGVELDRVRKMRRIGDEATINLLTVGRLVEKKGIAYAIRAVAETMKAYPALNYRIVGDGPLRDQLEDLIGELGIAENVRLLGPRSHDEVFALLNDTDIFLAPSVTDTNGDQEGIPVTLMEAMAHGLPVLSTRHSGIPELVEDGVHGFLVPERDVDALAVKLTCLVADAGMRLKMGAAGRKFVSDNYDNRKLNEELVEIYETLCERVRLSAEELDFRNTGAGL